MAHASESPPKIRAIVCSLVPALGPVSPATAHAICSDRDLFADLVRPLVHPRVFLKMDTQGYDLEVIRGATGCLGGIVAMQSEVSVQPLYDGMTHYTDALAHYEELGFTLMHLALVTRGNTHGNVVEYDALMARLDDGGRRD